MTSLGGITILMEGGGRGRKRDLRIGMGVFLQPLAEAARRKSLSFNVIPCGSRENTFRRFRDTVDNADPNETQILLVDSETLVTLPAPAHLRETDGWDLSFALEQTIHLMVQVMEAWIVADPKAVAQYYGQGFNLRKLPKRQALEQVPKTRVDKALKDATKRTGKGVYHKIRHAGELLMRLDRARVKERCRHCKRFFEALEGIIEAA